MRNATINFFHIIFGKPHTSKLSIAFLHIPGKNAQICDFQAFRKHQHDINVCVTLENRKFRHFRKGYEKNIRKPPRMRLSRNDDPRNYASNRQKRLRQFK